MKVMEVNRKIHQLELMRKNILQLQEYFLNHIENEYTLGKDIPSLETVIYLLEEGCNLTSPIRPLMSETAKTIDDEITRLRELVENTEIKLTW